MKKNIIRKTKNQRKTEKNGDTRKEIKEQNVRIKRDKLDGKWKTREVKEKERGIM